MTLTDATHLNADFLRTAFSDVSAWIYEQTGIRIPAEQLRFDLYTNPRGGASCEGRVYYAEPRPRPGTIPRIKLDLTVDELVALPPVIRPVGHPYSDLPEAGITAHCYAYEEGSYADTPYSAVLSEGPSGPSPASNTPEGSILAPLEDSYGAGGGN